MIKNILIDRHTKREFFFKSNYKITKLSSIKIFHFQERMHPRKNVIARNIPMMLYRVFKFFRELRFNFPRSVKLSNLVERDFSRVTTRSCSQMDFLKREFELLTASSFSAMHINARIAFYSGKARSLNSIPRPHLARLDHGTRPLSVAVAACKASRRTRMRV